MCTVHSGHNTEQGNSSSHWWNVLFAWPEGITAWLLLGTLGAILWQSFATAESAKAALLQIQMMKDKERARVEIKAVGLELTRVSEDFWHIRSSIEFSNVGVGRAYVRQGRGNLVIGDTGEPHWNSLDIVDGFIDPTAPSPSLSNSFQPKNADLPEDSQKICDGVLAASISGFIEYETVGTRFHRNFSYVWIGRGHPLNIGARVMVSDEFDPKTDEQEYPLAPGCQRVVGLAGTMGITKNTRWNQKRRGRSPARIQIRTPPVSPSASRAPGTGLKCKIATQCLKVPDRRPMLPFKLIYSEKYFLPIG